MYRRMEWFAEQYGVCVRTVQRRIDLIRKQRRIKVNKLDEMYAAKERHVKEIGELMAKDPDSGVESADYVKAGASEYVKIAYRGGESVYINVTINSLGAIHKEMVSEVYGSGAFGRVKSLPSVLYAAILFDSKEAGK